MNFAVFVVHAHESSLSMNDGRGYTKFYRALLQNAGKNLKINAACDMSYCDCN